jgi:hypothetical protein
VNRTVTLVTLAVCLLAVAPPPCVSQVLVNPANISQIGAAVAIKTVPVWRVAEDVPGGTRRTSLIGFTINLPADPSRGSAGDIGYLELAEGMRTLAHIPVAATTVDGHTSFEFDVHRSQLFESTFAFDAGQLYKIKLGDWYVGRNPVWANFDFGNPRIAAGDTMTVKVTIASDEPMRLAFTMGCLLTYRLVRWDGTVVPNVSSGCPCASDRLDLEPNVPRSFELRIPAQIPEHVGGFGGRPLEPGMYSLTCFVDTYADYGLAGETMILVVDK